MCLGEEYTAALMLAASTRISPATSADEKDVLRAYRKTRPRIYGTNSGWEDRPVEEDKE